MFKGIWVVVKNLLLMLLVLVVIFVIMFFAINIYTRKGQTVDVPKVTGMDIKKAIDKLNENELEYVIVDSVYDENIPKYFVTEQMPIAMNKVKRGRKIYLTVNSLDIPEVEMPEIAGKMSLEQAEKTLESKGLVLGEITPQPDPSITSENDKPVFEQLYRGSRIEPGTKIKRKSKIDLIIGVMIGNNATDTSDITEPEDPLLEKSDVEGIDN